MREFWEDSKFRVASGFYSDCGERAIKHWLLIQEGMFADLQRLRNRVVIHYERFAMGDTQGLCCDCATPASRPTGQYDKVLAFLGAQPQVHVPVEVSALKGARRREYRGNARLPVLNQTLTYAWIDSFERHIRSRMPDVCRQVAQRLEDQVAQYGCVHWTPAMMQC